MPLGAVATADQLLSTVAQHLDLSFEGQEESREQLLGFLRDREVLLILDQFEHLLDDESLAVLSALIDGAPDVTLLVTSRRRLELKGEQLLPLNGLALPRSERAAGAAAHDDEESAVDLFLAAMRRLQPSRDLTTSEMAHVADICRLVAGMPLALELAASWSDTLSLQEIAHALRGRLDLLETSAPNMPPRHRSIRATFATSWQGLEPARRQGLARMAVFRGGFTLAAAEAVADVSTPTLSRLARRSLVQHDAEQSRYDLHPLLQQYSNEKLREARANVNAVRHRHCAYTLGWLQQREGELSGGQEGDALKQMDVEMANIRHAWQWATEQGEVEELDKAADALHHYYRRRGHYQEGAATFASALEGLRQHHEDDDRRVEAKLLVFQADMLGEQGQSEPAKLYLEESLQVLQRAGHQGQDVRRERAFAWRCLALQTADAAGARRLLEKSVTLYRTLGAQSDVASVLADLGRLWKASGDLDRAEACFDESLALRRQLANPAAVIELSYYLAGLRMRRGHYAESERLLQEGLELARQIDDRPAIARGLLAYGHCYLESGRFNEATEAYRQSMGIREGLGMQASVAEAKALLSFALLHSGAYAEARLTGERALRLARVVDAAPVVATARGSVAGAAFAQGEGAMSARRFLQAAELYEKGWQVDWRARQALMRAYAACILSHQDNLDRARELLAKGLPVASEVGSLLALASVLPATALLLAKQGRIERAIEVWEAARTEPHVANSQWFADVVGSHVEEAASALPDSAVTAARGRGAKWKLGKLADDLLDSLV